MFKRLSLLLVLFLLWGCNRSSDPDQGSVEPIAAQGELINSAPEPVTEADTAEPARPEVSSASISNPAPSPQAVAASSAEAAADPAARLESELNEALNVASASGDGILSATGKDEGEYKFVAFDTLAGYEYFLTPLNESSLNKEEPEDQIPKHIRALDQQKVVIEGYMVPIDVEGERIQSFILTNSMMMCCYGAMPWINEWIFVEMEGDEGAGFFNDVVIRTKGILEVGEEIEDGMVISLYRMKGHEVTSTGQPIPFLFGN